MIKWNKIEAGEYQSEDGQFYIIKTWDRIYGNHWLLWDESGPDYYKSCFHETTLSACKLKAETLAKSRI